MTQQQAVGLGIMLMVLAVALIGSVWLLRRQEQARQGRRIQLAEPEPGTFAAAVLAAEGAANEYKYAVLTGNADVLRAAANRVMVTGNALQIAIRQREERARRRNIARTGQDPYAAGPRSVIVSESDRLAGEPSQQTGRRRAHAKEHHR